MSAINHNYEKNLISFLFFCSDPVACTEITLTDNLTVEEQSHKLLGCLRNLIVCTSLDSDASPCWNVQTISEWSQISFFLGQSQHFVAPCFFWALHEQSYFLWQHFAKKHCTGRNIGVLGEAGDPQERIGIWESKGIYLFSLCLAASRKTCIQ